MPNCVLVKPQSQRRDAAAGGIGCEQFLDVLRPVGGGDGNSGHDPGLMPLLPEAGDQVSIAPMLLSLFLPTIRFDSRFGGRVFGCLLAVVRTFLPILYVSNP